MEYIALDADVEIIPRLAVEVRQTSPEQSKANTKQTEIRSFHA